MTLSELVENSNTVSIPLYTLIIIVVVVFGVISLLVGAIIHLVKKIRFLTKIRYGFGGKPIFSFLVVFGMAITIPLTMYAFFKTVDVINRARAPREVFIEIYSEKKREGVYDVTFMAIPKINNKAWLDKSYTMKWYIEGKVTFEKIEKNRAIDNPSYFVKELPRGTYKIKVLVESDDFSVMKIEELILD